MPRAFLIKNKVRPAGGTAATREDRDGRPEEEAMEGETGYQSDGTLKKLPATKDLELVPAKGLPLCATPGEEEATPEKHSASPRAERPEAQPQAPGGTQEAPPETPTMVSQGINPVSDTTTSNDRPEGSGPRRPGITGGGGPGCNSWWWWEKAWYEFGVRRLLRGELGPLPSPCSWAAGGGRGDPPVKLAAAPGVRTTLPCRPQVFRPAPSRPPVLCQVWGSPSVGGATGVFMHPHSQPHPHHHPHPLPSPSRLPLPNLHHLQYQNHNQEAKPLPSFPETDPAAAQHPVVDVRISSTRLSGVRGCGVGAGGFSLQRGACSPYPLVDSVSPSMRPTHKSNLESIRTNKMGSKLNSHIDPKVYPSYPKQHHEHRCLDEPWKDSRGSTRSESRDSELCRGEGGDALRRLRLEYGEDAPRRTMNPPRYQCEACNKSYATFSGLSKHKQFHCISQVKKQFSCKFCDKTYVSLGALKMHIRTHTLPCKCHLCGKAFSRPWLLQGHVRTHTGEKPFQCAHCGRSFADRSNLRAHLQTHSDVKKYNCHACTKTFSRMSLLLKHQDGGCPGSL